MGGQLSSCVANNVAWCEAVLRTHGISGAIAKGVWACRDRVPPYYSNAITVDPSDAALQTEAMRDLEADLARPFSVKDSFAVLELASLGLRPLFDAEWIWRDPATRPPDNGPRDVRWRRVIGEEELRRWEAAWNNDSPADARIFLPDLLSSGEVGLFAAYHGDRLIAGYAANRSPGVVGFSNFFTEDADREPMMASAVGETMRFAPGLPVVGYESDDDLAAARRLGFQTVGPLRVWLAE